MEALRDSWCFCKGGAKSERTKASIFSTKTAAVTKISGAGSGAGFLIHHNLLLTTHGNLPSVAAAENSEICFQNSSFACLKPNRFFITSSILDLTIVGLDTTEGDSNAHVQQPHYLKTCSKPNLDLGCDIYLLGYTEKKELTVGEGKVVIATDNLIKLSTDGSIWSPGSAGFDAHGNLAFMVCDPMKLATSPNTRSSSTSTSSTSSWKKDIPMQFGIPIPIICDWLNQHWEGSLDELNKPKLPLIRLISVGPKCEHSCSSFTLRQVFKSDVNDGTPSSSNTISKPKDQLGSTRPAAGSTSIEETAINNPHATHVQGIPIPEIYESPKLTSVPVQKKGNAQIQLLDINFPPRITEAAVLPQPAKRVSDKNHIMELLLPHSPLREDTIKDRGMNSPRESTGSINIAHSEVQSSSSPIGISVMQNGYCSEQETMYSAETAESRNYTSPRDRKFHEVGRSQSCVSYNRWNTIQRNPVAGRGSLEEQRSFAHGRKMYSQGMSSQRSNDLCTPTVSSIMKKRNNSVQQPKPPPRQSAVHSSPRWLF